MKNKDSKRCKVGELRPSQALTTFGVGSIIDLPNLSVMVMGLEDWPFKDTVEIGEQRLLASVKEVLGHQVKALRSAPVVPDTYQVNQFDASALVGIPVAPFPRWMVCPRCRLLAPIDNNRIKLERAFRPDQVRYVHSNCQKMKIKPPAMIPARFIVACTNGHMDDFPWRFFVHRGANKCKGVLRFSEWTATGEAANIQIECEACGAKRRMSDAYMDPQSLLPCRGRHPHLRESHDGDCKAIDQSKTQVKPMSQGASNSWFGITLSALAIPPKGADEIAKIVDEQWTNLHDVESEREIEKLLPKVPSMRDLYDYTPAEIWKAVQAKKTAVPEESGEPTDLKTPEWEVFINPDSAEKGRDFQLRIAVPPKRYAKYFEKIVLAERLREVRALVGFTRIESPSDYDNPAAFPANQRARLSRTQPTWVPASEIRGEGLFFHFKEDEIQKWVKKAAIKTLHDVFLEAHMRWRIARKLEPPKEFYPDVRFVLLHSFAHALIRQLAVECGYTTASLRERIYSRNPGEDGPEMAGVLIYTAAPDSEGTLGGLVSLGKPETLERHLDQALDNMRLCASDPLCAEHHPYHEGNTLHAASCHACLFAPETSCERGNKYLDRAVLVSTVEKSDLAFFE